jgi:multidrug efflux system membrane fusion protein
MAQTVILIHSPPMKFHRIFLLVLLVPCVPIAWHFLPVGSREKAPRAPEGKRPVPVTTVAVTTRDVPIWLTGLGTVQAYNKVTVRPRVSGVLDKINFTEGQIVKEGDVLAVIDPRPYESLLAQAKAKVAQTQAQLGNARQTLDRVNGLVKSGAESRQVVDQMEANVAQFSAQEQADVAAVEAAQLNLDFTTVKAPISGRTGVRMIDQGNLVTASQEGGLVVVSQFQPISVIFTLPQDSLPALRKRILEETEKPVVQSLDDDGRILGEGKMALIDNEIDINSGTLKVKATFPNSELTLWPGQFLNARVLVETRKHAVVVPTQVITAGLDGPFVYIVKADKTVEARNVKPGPRVDEITLIEEGLKSGEEIVLDGQSKLQPDAAISIQPSKP